MVAILKFLGCILPLSLEAPVNISSQLPQALRNFILENCGFCLLLYLLLLFSVLAVAWKGS